MHSLIVWMERHQVMLYLCGIAIGALISFAVPQAAPVLETAILPVLALLLYTTFLELPLDQTRAAFKDRKFLLTLLGINFVVVPAVVWCLTRFIADDQVLLLGVLFVLLTPCIDYVIVFAGLAEGDTARLLTATPLLMLIQILLLPGFLWLFAGEQLVMLLDLVPFVEAFIWIILLPLAAAAVTQKLAQRHQSIQRWERGVGAAMVPLMMITLAVVIAALLGSVAHQLSRLWQLIPLYVLFAIVMILLTAVIGKSLKMTAPSHTSLIFSAVTRNSLVILPLVLALPAEFDLAPLVVVTQTMVELVLMVIMVQLVPRLVASAVEH